MNVFLGFAAIAALSLAVFAFAMAPRDPVVQPPVLIERVGDRVFRVTFPCGETELIEADSPEDLGAALAAHPHQDRP